MKFKLSGFGPVLFLAICFVSSLASGSMDALSQRNVSSLAPTDEGFHAWAFVSLFIFITYICAEVLCSSWQLSSSKGSSGPSRHLMVFF